MPEIKYRVHTNEIDCECDLCGKGWYRPTGEVYPTFPAQYPHKCTVCGAEMVVTGHTYPYIVTERAEVVTK